MKLATPLLLTMALAFTACAKQAAPEQKIAADGLPKWLDQPYFQQDTTTTICTSAESDFAVADVEAAKTDAETAAKNRIADQIEAKVGRLTERSNTAMKDLTKGKIVGERTLKDINQNFVEMSLPGLRYKEYHYMPDRLSPEKVFVWACVDFDTIEMSKKISNQMLSAAAEREQLEFKHEEAQIRFEEVRKQYLSEEGAQ